MRHEEGAEVFGSIMEYFKILMGIAKDNMIPEEQLYIHDEEMCPCGSGKIYADCCKGKCDTQPVPSVKPVEVLTMEHMRKELRQFHRCLHPDQANCNGKIKEAHALQNNKILSILSGSDNHVITQDHTKQPVILCEQGDEPRVIVQFEKISRNKATTQSCFCDYHDTIVFKPIEAGAPSFEPSNEEMKFIYAYKAFIFEYSKQLFLMDSMRRSFSQKPQFFAQREQVAEYRNQCMRMEEMNPIKQFFDSAIITGNHGGVYTCVVTIPWKIGFACYAFIGLDYDLNGQRIHLIDETGRMHRVALTVLPEEDQSYILLSCLEAEERYYHEFFKEIENSELNKTLYYFNLMLPLYSENIVLSEELWNKHGIEGQFALTHLANLYGEDQLNMSNTIAISLRNAAKKNNSNYSIRGKIDLFLRLEDNENGKA